MTSNFSLELLYRCVALHATIHGIQNSRMDPISDNDWMDKNKPIEEPESVGNIIRSWQWRERGIDPPNGPSNKTVLENVAEDILVQKRLENQRCDLPGYPRSTFLMVFSPDGTKVASTHGNHNIYVSELASGRHVSILKGHPRTPWCIAFHPSHPQLIGSGCLGGQVRVWDSTGGSETWTVETETVISSLAFHPRDQILVIATFSELYFWNWSQPAPFTRVSTNNFNEKVKYVAFDPLGFKLITGIICSESVNTNTAFQENIPHNRNGGGDNNGNNGDSPDNRGNRPDNDNIVNSYQHLVQRYDVLVRNYQRLFSARHQLNSRYAPNMMDRGTDPMEADVNGGSSTASTSANEENNARPAPRPAPSRQVTNNTNDEDGQFLVTPNLFRAARNAMQAETSQGDSPTLPSRQSAFQRFCDLERRLLSAASSDEFPLYFGPLAMARDPLAMVRDPLSNIPLEQTSNQGSSRTNVFVSPRPDTPPPRLLHQIRESIQNRIRAQSSLSGSNDSTTPNISNNPRSDDTNTTSARTRPTESPSRSESSTSQSSNGASLLATNPLSFRRPLGATSDETPDSPLIRYLINIYSGEIMDAASLPRNMPPNLFRRSSVPPSDVPQEPSSAAGPSSDTDSAAMEQPENRARSPVPRRSNRVVIDLNPTRPHRQVRFNSARRPMTGTLRMFLTKLYKSRFRARDNAARNRETAHNSNTNDGGSSNDRQTPEPGPSRDFRSEPSTSTQSEPHDYSNTSNSNDNSNINDGSNINDDSNINGNSNINDNANSNDNEDSNANNNDNGNSNISDDLDINDDSNGNDNSNNNSTSNGSNRNNNEGGPDSALTALKVNAAIRALNRHTRVLNLMLERGRPTTFSELLNLWDGLRRRILTIELERTPQPESRDSQHDESFVERLRLIADLSRSVLNDMPCIRIRRVPRSQRSETNGGENDSATTPDNNGNDDEAQPSTSSQEPQPSTSRSRTSRNMRLARTRYFLLRKRLNLVTRLRLNEESRRNMSRTQRVNARSDTLWSSRTEIRLRAMQVLSMLFYLMIDCLEINGLSDSIIVMLETLKRSLRLTCLLLASSESNANRTQSRDGSTNVNVNNPTQMDHNYVPGPGTPSTSRGTTNRPMNVDRSTNISSGPTKRKVTTKQNSSQTCNIVEPIPESSSPVNPRDIEPPWSNRLAVQISDANRNYSTTAQNRKEQYIESKREKALHKCNPAAHPISKRKLMPPSASHRIPSIRRAPSRPRVPRQPPKSRNQDTQIDFETNMPGPSNTQRGPSSSLFSQRTPSDFNVSANDLPNDINNPNDLYRIAQLSATRARNAARDRLRRLQAIRFFAAARDSDIEVYDGFLERSRRPRPIVVHRSEHLESLLQQMGVPIVQVNGMDAINDDQANQPPVIARVQPIILAQNFVIDDVPTGPGVLDSTFMPEMLPVHRVQAWDFTSGCPPDISNRTKNVVVQRCRIHNDASIDISKDGRLLVALLPVPRLRNSIHRLGVYSLEWNTLGQCLHTAALEQSAVSVALSPTARYLAVGLGSRRFTYLPHPRNNVFAYLYKLNQSETSSRTGMTPIKELEQNWEQQFTSLNCLRWAPQPGQGLVYANNTGQLILMS